MSSPDDGVGRSRRVTPTAAIPAPVALGATPSTGAARELDVEGGTLYRLLVESVRDYAIFALDSLGHILSWNAGAERLKGYKPAEIIGRHFSIFYEAGDIASGKPAMELRVATRDGKYEEEGWRLRKDGSRFWASVLITALHGRDGTVVGFAKVTRDLTERRAGQEKAIADARRVAAAEGANRIKSEFLAAMSHELRTPINATMGYAQLLELGIAGTVAEQQRDYLGRIRSAQEHLLRIITDLLNYSRIEAGQVQYDVAPMSVRTLIETVLPMVGPQAVTKGIAIEQGSMPEDLVVHADRTRAQQIMLNLLSNAVKFTPAGGRITVGCTTVGTAAAITVDDTGPGIPPDEQDAIFEPFVQLGRSLSSEHEGTGLGLAISRDLARGMGGDLTVESIPGHGATFSWTVPQA